MGLKEEKVSEQIWITIITAIVAPLILFVCQLIREHRTNLKAMVLEHHEQCLAQIKDTRLQTLRLEILFTLKHHPDDKKTILGLYDKYVSLGGNSFITEYVNNWKRASQKKGKKK